MSDAWIQTFTGRKVYPMSLVPSDICIEDIAHHLSMLTRFTGATREFYSVAQHSVWVSSYAAPDDALWGLLHDASEAYLIDLPRPLKRAPQFQFYRVIESLVMEAICLRFGLYPTMPASVREADERMLATEARDLMGPLHPDWRVMAVPYERKIIGWDPSLAERMFLSKFAQLRRGAA